MIKKLKEKKGFTLVELIVVLVILAILAALLVPALTGYIDRAKEKDVIAETRQAVMAAQTLVDEEYAKADVGADTVKLNTGKVTIANIKKLAEIDGTISATDFVVTNGKVTKLVYTNKKKTCTYSVASGASKGTYEVN